MLSKTNVFKSLLLVLLLCDLPQTTRAEEVDETYFVGALYGNWRDVQTGDSYSFGRNRTYVFRAGERKSRSGNLSHSGTWSLYSPNFSTPVASHLPLEATPYGLKLSATQRQVSNRGKIESRPAHRVFKLIYQRIVLNSPPGVSAYFSPKGRYYYYREPANPRNVHRLALANANNPNRLFIEKTSFTRVK